MKEGDKIKLREEFYDTIKKGRYWFAPYDRLKKMIDPNKIYEAEMIYYYPEYGEERILIAHDLANCVGCKNFPKKWFKVVKRKK